MMAKAAEIMGNVLFFVVGFVLLAIIVMTIFWDSIGMWVVGMVWPGLR